VDDQLYAKAVKVVRDMQSHRMNDPLFLERNLKIEPATAHQLFVRLEKEGIVTPRDSHSERSYVFPKPAPAQTSAQQPAGQLDRAEQLAGSVVKPPTQAQIRKQVEDLAKQEREFKRRQDEHERNERIEKEYRALFFASLAKKAQINSRLLTHVVPIMIFEIWENELPIEVFAQEVLLWPAPKDGHAYNYEEVKKYSAKHTRKFTGGLLAAMILTLYMNEAEKVKIAKYMGVDPKKLRQKAIAAVKEEERIAAAPKVKLGANLKKQLFASVNCYDGANIRWAAMRKEGANDEELLRRIKREMGTGGKGGKWGTVSFKSCMPAVWFNTVGPTGKPSLEGPKLVAAVRELLNIPEKGDVDA
jgi:hypothetical protein